VLVLWHPSLFRSITSSIQDDIPVTTRMSEFVETAAALIDALKAGQKKVGVRYVNLSDEDAAAVAVAIAADTATTRLR